MSDLKFGTDGWRAVIAEMYTFENVNRVSQAVALWLQEIGKEQNGVVIGYDARFLSQEFAQHTASVFASLGIGVRMSERISPTPAISQAAYEYDAFGIVITASHNPPEYNGYKIKAPFGGSALPGQIAGIERFLPMAKNPVKTESYKKYVKLGLIRELDLVSSYLDKIRNRIDLNAIKKAGLKIAHDPMYGSGSGIIKELLDDELVVEIHNERNPLFGGSAPEPVEDKLGELTETTVKHGCGLGIANDGDADRITLVDEKGTFVSSHKILSLLIEYLHQTKKLSGTVVKTFSTTNMIDKQAEKYELPLEVTPVGFKYIAEIMVNDDVLVGGEESGGLAAKGHIPERDGIYIGLLIAEMIVKTNKTLSELVQDLFDEYGSHQYYRNDILTEEHKKIAMITFCKNRQLTAIAGKKVIGWDVTDGIKHLLEDGSWLLVRQSGTEPVLRIYAEASTSELARSLVDDVTTWIDKPDIL